MPNTATHQRRPGLARLAALLLAIAACSDEAPPAAPEPAAAPEPTRTAAPAPRASVPGTPTAGNAELRIGPDGVTLLANAAPRRPLLEQLAAELDFRLDAPGIADEPINVIARSASLDDVLPQLLPDRAYRVSYRLVGTQHEIARLDIAPLGAAMVLDPADYAVVAPPTLTFERPPEPEGEPVRPRSPREAAEGLRSPSDLDEEAWVAMLDRLEDASDEDRVETISEIEPTNAGLDVLAERLENDPLPAARVAAIEQLEDSETRFATDALIRALQDPDKQVVLAAIDALEFTDDESVALDIAPLERHPDAEIAEAARDAVCFIADCD